jgi:septal ring factor EnvC (AmiA/AmiB activator)
MIEMRKIDLILVCIIFLLPINVLAQKYDDRFNRSQNKQEYGDGTRDHYQEQQQQREEMNRRLEEQGRQLNKLKRQQDELRNQIEFNRK